MNARHDHFQYNLNIILQLPRILLIAQEFLNRLQVYNNEILKFIEIMTPCVLIITSGVNEYKVAMAYHYNHSHHNSTGLLQNYVQF